MSSPRIICAVADRGIICNYGSRCLATLNRPDSRCATGTGCAQQAQANLDLLDAQMAKLTIYAPMDGVVLTRNVDPGEFVQPGGAAMTMADLNELTITVYVPEDRYGEIHLGQTVDLTVDSFPGETFTATVSSICRSSRIHTAQCANCCRAQRHGLCREIKGQ